MGSMPHFPPLQHQHPTLPPLGQPVGYSIHHSERLHAMLPRPQANEPNPPPPYHPHQHQRQQQQQQQHQHQQQQQQHQHHQLPPMPGSLWRSTNPSLPSSLPASAWLQGCPTHWQHHSPPQHRHQQYQHPHQHQRHQQQHRSPQHAGDSSNSHDLKLDDSFPANSVGRKERLASRESAQGEASDSQAGNGTANGNKSPATAARATFCKPKLTPSCARCRAKKLKCDQQVPCSNCIVKKLEHECHKEERAPRQPKKRKGDASFDGGADEAGGSGDKDPEALEVLKQRIVELERLLARTGSTHATQSIRQHKVEGTAAFLEEYIIREALSFTPVAITGVHPCTADMPNSSGISMLAPTTMTAAVTSPNTGSPLRQQGNSHRTVVAYMNEFGGAKLRERPNAFWEKNENQEARVHLVESVRSLLAELGPQVRADLLRYCWPIRAMGMFDRCIWVPEVVENIERFIHRTHQYADGWNDMNELALFCMAISVAIQFYPGVGTVRRTLPATMKHWNKGKLMLFRNAGRECLALEQNMAIASLEGLQALILLSGQGLDDADYSAFLDDILRRGVIRMELNKLGSLSMLGYEPGTTVEQCRRKEMAVRVFWHVVSRDWSLGQSTRTYTFLPEQITTRPPLNLKDVDMRQVPFAPSRPFDEWTETYMFIAKIHLSHIVRGSIDMLNEQAQKGGSSRVWNQGNRAILDEQYQFFLKQLPSFFQLDIPFEGPSETQKGAAEVQRWLLHQLVFSLLLKLHRSDLGKKRVQSSCISLSYVILEIHDKVRKRCRVIDSLAINQDHVYSACIVLLLDLYADHSAEARRATGLDRIMIRSKIRRAAGWLDKTQPRTAKAARLLERLLDEEERHVQENGESGVVGYTRLIEIAASMNEEEQARARGETCSLRPSHLTDSHQSKVDTGLHKESSPGSISRSTCLSSETPATPVDTALYPSLVWPYEGPPPALTTAANVLQVLRFPSASSAMPPAPSCTGSTSTDALHALASGSGSRDGSSNGSPAAFGALASTPARSIASMGDGRSAKVPVIALDPSQSFNDDLLWQMVFGKTTQTGLQKSR
ncbi:hypothetical protein K437DRAFT_191045 [Tilletiaria anomala UBC 951]|uniref:Zn(2)-C6 fungal-type domain-containing protein n=1 Tax=Tilletiaria anomala (strain ATCC 24038 / CBS 436.72 / UBC 951) TaxID=1037660 RepID=A0A066VNT9_TILAU|nr:uncharacterized protein K437DRAFT_191045 [Tilletiaria anomala UBC 951]KDN40250.1 hypothetical protein K437DRAFT_191045 [Tilletiaria anomala UBC 951]